MGFRDENGDIVGFDIDLAAEVCQRLGVELELQPIDWDAKELELSSGKVAVSYTHLDVYKRQEQGFQITAACRSCGLCARRCPQGCIQAGQPYRILQNHCLHCGLCAEVCPSRAIISQGGTPC